MASKDRCFIIPRAGIGSNNTNCKYHHHEPCKVADTNRLTRLFRVISVHNTVHDCFGKTYD